MYTLACIYLYMYICIHIYICMVYTCPYLQTQMYHDQLPEYHYTCTCTYTVYIYIYIHILLPGLTASIVIRIGFQLDLLGSFASPYHTVFWYLWEIIERDDCGRSVALCVLPCVTMCCHVLPCVTMWCNVMQRGAASHPSGR